MPRSTFIALTVILSLASMAHAQELPPVSERMPGKGAVACIMVSDAGSIAGTYLLSTSGDIATDRDMLAWVKQLRWDAAKPGEKMRNVWFSTGLAFGDAKAPEASTTCSPPPDRLLPPSHSWAVARLASCSTTNFPRVG
jgi:hypothetical protein